MDLSILPRDLQLLILSKCISIDMKHILGIPPRKIKIPEDVATRVNNAMANKPKWNWNNMYANLYLGQREQKRNDEVLTKYNYIIIKEPDRYIVACSSDNTSGYHVVYMD
jgi:hypothetical protein